MADSPPNPRIPKAEASWRPVLRKAFPIGITLVIGLSITTGVFFLFQGTDRARLRADFVNTAADRAHAIRAGLVEDFIELNLLGSYISAARELAQGQLGAFAQEFGRFSGRIPGLEPDTQVVAFISRVHSSERAEFEARTRNEIDPEFQILEPSPDGGFRPAGSRPDYFPIMVVEPLEFGAAISGLDLSSVPAFRVAIDRAIATGTIVASESTSLPQRTAERTTVWHFLALYRKTGSEKEPPGARGADRPRGFLVQDRSEGGALSEGPEPCRASTWSCWTRRRPPASSSSITTSRGFPATMPWAW